MTVGFDTLVQPNQTGGEHTHLHLPSLEQLRGGDVLVDLAGAVLDHPRQVEGLAQAADLAEGLQQGPVGVAAAVVELVEGEGDAAVTLQSESPNQGWINFHVE